ncbi:SGNH hydrolase domain-containing protein, partial [Candidatus Pelagibacter sp.]|nr:SGNH hydrolase domain-containing protein [Candidatus Pelagibacter sp.]
KIIKFNKLYVLGATIILMITGIHTSVDYQKKQYPNITHDLYEKTWLNTKTYFRPCFQRKTFFCTFIENKDNPTIFLVGDSILASIQEELKDILMQKSFNFIPMTNAGCDFLKNEKMFRSECNKKLFDNKTKKILETKSSTIILHLNYSTDFEENVLKDFLKSIKSYLSKDYKIILIYPIPQMEENVSSQIGKNINKNKLPIDIVNISLAKYLKESKQVVDLFDSMNHKNLYKIYPYKNFCNSYLKDKCIANTQDHIYYIDSLHLSKKGSELISIDLANIIDNIY